MMTLMLQMALANLPGLQTCPPSTMPLLRDWSHHSMAHLQPWALIIHHKHLAGHIVLQRYSSFLSVNGGHN